MGKKVFETWISKFAVFTVIVFVVLEAFEYVVFGDFLYFKSVLAGYEVASAIVFSVFLGIVFATAQYVLCPRSSPACMPASTKKVVMKRAAKKQRKSGRKRKAKKRAKI